MVLLGLSLVRLVAPPGLCRADHPCGSSRIVIDDDQQLGEPPAEALAPKATISLSFAMEATASVLHRLAGNHLWGATHFSRTVRAIETANAGRKFEDGTFSAEIQAGFHACVMLCGA